MIEEKLGIEDHDIEVEYQSTTIGKYDIDFNGTNFILTSKLTDCLAKDNCGIPQEKPQVKISQIQNSCEPGSGCC